jgi:hypothetical protein
MKYRITSIAISPPAAEDDGDKIRHAERVTPDQGFTAELRGATGCKFDAGPVSNADGDQKPIPRSPRGVR